MPFITNEARHITDTLGPREVGDKCFLHYREMLRAWRKSLRWTTAHDLYRDMVLIPEQDNADIATGTSSVRQAYFDDLAARKLAWQVFFTLHVLPYEMQKRTLNGEVDF